MPRVTFGLLMTLLLAGGLGWQPPDAVSQSAPMSSSKPAELDPFEQKVRDYLLKHPEVLVEAMQILQDRQQTAAAEELKEVIASRGDEIFDEPGDPVAGNPAGDVTLVEFFDYNCPYCRKAASTVVDLEKADPGVKIVYKEFPILGPGSEFAARASLASTQQGKYAALHHALMKAEGRVNEDSVMAIAEEIGLDVEQLSQDMQSPEITAAIERNQQLAAALGITGTPSFIIGEQIIPGAVELEKLQTLIASTRNRSVSDRSGGSATADQSSQDHQ